MKQKGRYSYSFSDEAESRHRKMKCWMPKWEEIIQMKLCHLNFIK